MRLLAQPSTRPSRTGPRMFPQTLRNPSWVILSVVSDTDYHSTVLLRRPRNHLVGFRYFVQRGASRARANGLSVANH